MKKDENRRDTIIEYICNISGNRVKPLPLYNEKNFTFKNLRAIAFRWFCIKHKIKLLDLMELLDNTKYSASYSSNKLGVSKKELKEKNEKVI